MNPDRSSIVLVLGGLSLVSCAPLGIAAWVMGASALREDSGDHRDRLAGVDRTDATLHRARPVPEVVGSRDGLGGQLAGF
ncbi:MAG: hypothetical protein GY704_02765, partial [Phycisphaeraceae bacterium]|nr:hypothetical protein [Phycisphaeraceae bacterium]